jgi:hypothetical protein
MLQRLLHSALGDLIEKHAAHIAALAVEPLRNVPGDRFTLAVGIGREVDVFLALRCLAQFGDDLPFAVNHLVVGREVFLEIDPELALRQVDEMSDRRLHLVVATEVFGERPRLGGRLDNDEMLGHERSVHRTSGAREALTRQLPHHTT